MLKLSTPTHLREAPAPTWTRFSPRTRYATRGGNRYVGPKH